MKKKLFISLLIGVVCGYYAVRDVALAEFTESLRQTKPIWLLATLPLFVLTHIARTFRWQTLLRPVREVSFKPLFGINAVGFMMVSVLPLRLGELVRPLLLHRREKVPYSAALATSVVERVFDMICVLAILMVGALLAPVSDQPVPLLSWSLSTMVRLGALAIAPLIVGLLALALWQDRALAILTRILTPLPASFRQRILDLARTFVTGLHALRGWRPLAATFFGSLLIWSCIIVITWCTFRAMNLDLPWYAPFTVTGVLCVGIMIPGPPGFVGNYELFCKAGLALFAVHEAMALSYALVSHVLNLGFVVAAGLVYLPFYSFSMREVEQAEDDFLDPHSDHNLQINSGS